MLNNIEEVQSMVEGAYKKLKSYYYYDKTLLHLKMKIVDFETDGRFKEKLKILSKNIVENNQEYFEGFIKNIGVVILPKSFKSINEDIRLVKGSIDKNKKISKINFIIDLPVELLIVDFMWTLFVKKIHLQNFGEFKYSYASRFKKGIFNEILDFKEGIDLKSNRCFEPYFKAYTKWRNSALETVKKASAKGNVSMISLDLKSFYYSVNFEFVTLEKILGTDKCYREISHFTSIIEKIYKKYTKTVVKYKKGIEKAEEKNILPIGLISPIYIRDVILEPIDTMIVERLCPEYYGRYVDDLLIVVSVEGIKNISTDKIIEDILVQNEILKSKNKEGEYTFSINPSIKLQGEKINCFYFEKGKENILLDVYYKKIKKNSSEGNLLPDIDLLNESFNNIAYSLNSSDNTGKIRNLEFMGSDNYSATLFIGGLKQILKNTTYSNTFEKKFLFQITEFYTGSQAIEFSNTWRTIFELMVLCKEKDIANQFYLNIRAEIDEITFESLETTEIYSNKKKTVLANLKKSLFLKLEVAIALAISLDYDRGKVAKHKREGQKIRQANMLNHTMLSFPLVNYSECESVNKEPLINMNLSKILSDLSKRKEIFQLDEEKLKWSPRFIHLNELYFCTFYFTIGSGRRLVRRDNEPIFKSYIRINCLSERISNPIVSETETEIDGLNVIRKNITIREEIVRDKTKIGLVNTKINEDEVLDILLHPEKGVTVEKKQKLYKILNNAKENNVHYLIFPEFYMPALWLNDIGGFIKRYGITIVTGLQYITCDKRAFNVVCVIKSACGTTSFKNTIPFFREKNYYAPGERIDLAALGYISKNPDKSIYYLIENGLEKFSTILCFEFTDIVSRTIMKGELDFLCVPQLNRDTNYFSSIVESAARDLYTLVVQANTSKYGDSRITGPYKTQHRDILKIKGGENDILIVGELDLKRLQKFKTNYYSDFERQIGKCLNCKKVHTPTQLMKKCKKCRNDENIVKALPPNWEWNKRI